MGCHSLDKTSLQGLTRKVDITAKELYLLLYTTVLSFGPEIGTATSRLRVPRSRKYIHEKQWRRFVRSLKKGGVTYFIIRRQVSDAFPWR